ncbi:flavin-containing monooxygenase [Kutzneria sp. CA-103260]|uniref:flavin-containing monooxygenase n=1 Tax=Kutzneria sp. CA-103260 TaxID=2802641 RepID=UPI001BA8062A|nr:NAD(P)/FAD-dependent oxidoreductase [Kutzneria sp. CA-103260]QUQ72138.1 cyclohexanone monooxygenase [Kutzneria sp. CA-103260]
MTTGEYEVVVIGAGASGIGAAVRLLDQGVRDFVVLEKGNAVGGTWRDNTYPGCGCDVPSRLYSYTFAPNPEWSRVFAKQPEILAYLGDTATRFGVTSHLRLGVEVHEARWDAAALRWRLSTSDGEITARAIIAAAGPWHTPNLPDIPGLQDFDGPVFHSSRWDHDVDLTGKRVAVVGSGASAVQFVPAIAPAVRQLHLFQRTPQWVLPKPDHHIPQVERRLLRWHRARAALRGLEYRTLEGLGFAFRHLRTQPVLRAIAKAHIRRAISDPSLRRKVTPDYPVGCTRPLVSNDYYPALTRPNVQVHATGVAEIRGNTVIAADGTTAEVDAIILGTGFRILDLPIAERVFDADGASLADHWQGSPQAYLGTTVAGFPNLFLVLGPSVGVINSAFVLIEAQLTYIMNALRHLRTTLEVRRPVQDAFNARVQAALPGTAYHAGGCRSYYIDANGRNSFSWPWSTDRVIELLGRFDPADYRVGEHLREGAKA